MNLPEETGRDMKLPLTEDAHPEAEARKIRRLQLMISMVSSVISQDPNLTLEEASELAAGAKRAVHDHRARLRLQDGEHFVEHDRTMTAGRRAAMTAFHRTRARTTSFRRDRRERLALPPVAAKLGG